MGCCCCARKVCVNAFKPLAIMREKPLTTMLSLVQNISSSQGIGGEKDVTTTPLE
jgi:hypothetical protein